MNYIGDILDWCPPATIDWLLQVENDGTAVSDMANERGLFVLELTSNFPVTGTFLHDFSKPTLYVVKELSIDLVQGYGWIMTQNSAEGYDGPLDSVERTRFVKTSTITGGLRYAQVSQTSGDFLSVIFCEESGNDLACMSVRVQRKTGKVLAKNTFDLHRTCSFCSLRTSSCKCPSMLKTGERDHLHAVAIDQLQEEGLKSSDNGEYLDGVWNAFILFWNTYMEGRWLYQSAMGLDLAFEYKLISSPMKVGQHIAAIDECSQRKAHEALARSAVNYENPVVADFNKTSSGIIVSTSVADAFASRSTTPLASGDLWSLTASERSLKTMNDGSVPSSSNSLPGFHDCSACGKRFTRNYDLRRHYDAVHLQLRQHKCKDCGKGFNQASHLRDHWSQIHGEKHIRCTFQGCNKTFAVRHRYDRHVKGSHQGRSFGCDKCNRSYRERSHMLKHRRTCNGTPSPRRRNDNNGGQAFVLFSQF
uniref:C2H2-type domain-containing protein n=1 Tax=Rhodosorus marinus TaxID=101924 RepID=A0A7S3A323_9RHOD|mmetsp:Transcript_41652/g.163583  ORF Transcript_41652/g.163583 Transcript_41652/m.163583 type:complete len:476 (+) Transcript_41652:102-1529(+)